MLEISDNTVFMPEYSGLRQEAACANPGGDTGGCGLRLRIWPGPKALHTAAKNKAGF